MSQMTDTTLPTPDIADLKSYMQSNLASISSPAQAGPPLSDGAIEQLYSLGYRLLVAEQPEQALSVFAFLFAQRPTDPRVLSGFGHCMLGTGSSAQAAVMHSLAMTAEPDNPGHALALAEALIAMRSPAAATLLEAVRHAAVAANRGAVADRARALLTILRQPEAGTPG